MVRFQSTKIYIFKGYLPLCLKIKVYDQYVPPALIYGSKTWTLTKRQLEKLQTTQRRMEKAILGIRLMDKKTNKWIREQTGLTDNTGKFKRCAGHVMSMGD